MSLLSNPSLNIPSPILSLFHPTAPPTCPTNMAVFGFVGRGRRWGKEVVVAVGVKIIAIAIPIKTVQ